MVWQIKGPLCKDIEPYAQTTSKELLQNTSSSRYKSALDLYFVVCDDCGRGATSKSAGMITRSNGEIAKYDDEGGSFKANDLSMLEAGLHKVFLAPKGCRGCISYGAASMILCHPRNRKTKKRYSHISRLYRNVRDYKLPMLHCLTYWLLFFLSPSASAERADPISAMTPT